RGSNTDQGNSILDYLGEVTVEPITSDVKLYFDIDYFLESDREVTSKEIVGNVRDYAFEA
ncbi:MAG: hypothetical protein COX51_03365, partial [Syntrophobacteraceae bacterium CG23_combo_of_CG06-09_8_20_14_all_50_8]